MDEWMDGWMDELSALNACHQNGISYFFSLLLLTSSILLFLLFFILFLLVGVRTR